MFAVDMVPVVVVVVVLPVAAFDLASAAFCASRAAFRLGLAPIITLKDNLEMRKKKLFGQITFPPSSQVQINS